MTNLGNGRAHPVPRGAESFPRPEAHRSFQNWPNGTPMSRSDFHSAVGASQARQREASSIHVRESPQPTQQPSAYSHLAASSSQPYHRPVPLHPFGPGQYHSTPVQDRSQDSYGRHPPVLERPAHTQATYSFSAVQRPASFMDSRHTSLYERDWGTRSMTSESNGHHSAAAPRGLQYARPDQDRMHHHPQAAGMSHITVIL